MPFFGSSAQAANKTWDGAGTTDLWSDAANWNAAVTPGSTLRFDGTTRVNNTNDFAANTTFNGIQFQATAGNFVLNGNAITLHGNIADTKTTAPQIINLDLVLDGNRNVTVLGGGELEIAGNISGAFTLTKDNTGTLVLSGNNSSITLAYRDTTSGAIDLQSATALGATTSLSVPTGDALELGGGSAPDLSISGVSLTLNGSGISSGGALRNVSGDNSWGGAITLGGNTRINSDSGTVTLDVASGNAITGTADNLTFGGAGDIRVNDAIATTSGTLTKDGPGTLTLAGDNTYTGATTVNAGVLNIQHANALGTTASGTTVSSGAALQIQGGISTASEVLTINGSGIANDGALRNVSGDNTYAGTISVASNSRINSDAGTLTVGAGINESGNALKTLTIGGDGNVTVTGNITADTGDLALVKDGSGTLTLSGTGNNYDGGTTLSAGRLALGADNVLPNTGTFTFAGGILDANSHTDAIGPLSLTADSTLNLGSDTGTHGSLTFASATWTGGTLTIDGWVGIHDTTGDDDHLFVTADPTASDILAHIQFTGYALGATWLSATGEIVPVPEPINVALGIFAGVLVGWGIGRRFCGRGCRQA